MDHGCNAEPNAAANAGTGRMRTEHSVAVLCLSRAWKLHVLLCALVVMPVLIRAAADLEITIEMDSTWQTQTATNRHIYRYPGV